MREKLKKNKIILILILSVVLLLMGVVYGAFSTILNINGTAKIRKDWNVYIESMLVTNINGNASGSSEVGLDRLSASYVSILHEVGDYVEYTAHVVNKGTLRAELSNILLNEQNSSEYIKHQITNINLEENHPILEPNGSIDILIRTTYVVDKNGNAYFGEEELTDNVSFQLTFIQYDGSQENGGSSEPQINLGTTLLSGDVSAAQNGDVPWTYSDTGVLRVSGIGKMRDLNYPTGPLIIQIAISYLRSKGIDEPKIIGGMAPFTKALYDIIYSQEYFDSKYPGFVDWYTHFSTQTYHDDVTDEEEHLTEKEIQLLLTYTEELPRITSIIIDNGVTSIGHSAFIDTGLTSVTIPDSVTSIGNNAFENNQLSSLTIPDSLTSIGSNAFASNRLTSVTIPGSVTSIGNSAFENNRLSSLTISNGVESIGSYAFWKNQLTSVIIPGSVTNIGNNAFENNQLSSLTISNGVANIGNYAFWKNQLTSVTIPGSVTSIGNNAFLANKIKNITISEGVINIGSYAFSDNQITSVTIPSTVTRIGDRSFATNQIANLTISNGVTSIEDYAFYQNELTSLIIPSSVTSIGSVAFAYNKLSDITIEGKPTVANDAFDHNRITSRDNIHTTLNTSGWQLNYNYD